LEGLFWEEEEIILQRVIFELNDSFFHFLQLWERSKNTIEQVSDYFGKI